MERWFVFLFCNKIGDSVLAIFLSSSSCTHVHKCTCAQAFIASYKCVQK
jgi:hypothetical protein